MSVRHLNKAALAHLASDNDYRMGESHVHGDAVRNVVLLDDTLAGTVHDAKKYRPQLYDDEHHRLGFSCTCPQVQYEGKMCSHVVALGLAYLDSQVDVRSLQPVRDWLQGKDLDWVIDFVLDQALANDKLCDKLLLEHDL